MADMRTKAREVYDSFEASFQDKSIIPIALEFEWLRKAIARYSVELDPITFDEENLVFSEKLDRYVIDTCFYCFKRHIY